MLTFGLCAPEPLSAEGTAGAIAAGPQVESAAECHQGAGADAAGPPTVEMVEPIGDAPTLVLAVPSIPIVLCPPAEAADAVDHLVLASRAPPR
jgi:hypothetical protein